MKARILGSLLEIMIGKVFFCAVLGVLSQEVHISEAQVKNANAKHVTQTKLFDDDIKSWLYPHNGVLATKNTPVYGVVKKPKISKKDTGYEITEYKDAMKDALAYLRVNKSYAIITPSNIPPNASQAKNTVVGNKNPVRLKTMNDKNRKLTTIFRKQMTSYSSLPYPTIVYPEILVIVDNALFKKLGSNVRDVVIHILAFWNGVDLLFRNLESPKFRFNVEAIIIVEAPNVFTNVEYAPNKTDAYQLKPTIDRWLYSYQREFPIDSYDIAAFMTANDLFRKSGKRLGGISSNAGACKTFHKSKRVVKTACVREVGDFLGIRLMAHELGHLFGISGHDGYDAKRCPVKDGTIMTPNGFDLGPKFYEWSQCSLDKLTQSFVKNNLSCLYNEIYEHGVAVPRILPGKLMDLDKQCHFQRANSTPVTGQDNCKHFRCRTNLKPPFYRLFSLSIGLLDGTSCGQGKMCLLGSCVQENLINDPSIHGKKT